MKTFHPHFRYALQVLAASLMPLATACMTGVPEAGNAGQPDGGAEILMEKNGATNVALGGTATQSSTTYSGSPARAIDGNTSGRWAENSVTHTANTAAPWWRVDLGNAHRVDGVTLWNRTDCCTARLSNFHVDYLGADGNVIVSQDYPGQAGPTTEITLSALGVYAVRVQLYGAAPLSLAEVQVWGAAPESTTPNVALGATASQSSTTYGGDPARAIDGNTSGLYGGFSVTHTAQTLAPWWRVDLGKAHRVDRVSLWNRTDCCTARLSNFHVDYLDAEGNVIVSQDHPGQAGVRTEIVLSARGVHAVRVQLYDTNPLSLAEVQVWGAPDAGSDDRPKWCVGADTDAVAPPIYDDGIACNFCPSLNANTAVGWEKDGICSKARMTAILTDLRIPGGGACAAARAKMASTCCIADYQPPRDPMRVLCVDQPGPYPSVDLCNDGCFPSSANTAHAEPLSGPLGYWVTQQGDRTNTCLANDYSVTNGIGWTCRKAYYLTKYGHLPPQLANEVRLWWNGAFSLSAHCGCDGENTNNPDNQN